MGLTQRLGTIPLAIQTDSSNNVGIGGAANASYKLAVTGASLFSSNILANGVMSLGDDGTYGATYKTLGLTGNTDGTHRILAGTSDDMYIAAATSRGIKFCVNGSITTRAIITSTGNVGIGTSSPTGTYGKLSVAGGISILDDNNAKLEIGRYSSGAANSYIKIGTNSASLRITNAADSADLVTFTNSGYVGIGTSSPNDRLVVQGGSNIWCAKFTANNVQSDAFGVQIFAGTTASDTAFRVLNAATNSEYLKVRGDGYLFSIPTYNNQWAGYSANMYVANDGSFGRTTPSSGRYKDNINEWSGKGLETILALKPKTFKYKKEYCETADIDFLGLIAEEVAEVSPYLAQYENPDRTGLVENVRYDTIVVPLIAAIQEQQVLISELSAKVTALENK